MHEPVLSTKLAEWPPDGELLPSRSLGIGAAWEAIERLRAVCVVLLERGEDSEGVNRFFFDVLIAVFGAMTIEAQDMFRPKLTQMIADEARRLDVGLGATLDRAEQDPALPLATVAIGLERIEALIGQIEALSADQAAGELREQARKDRARKTAQRSYVKLSVLMQNSPRATRAWRSARLVSTGVTATRNRDRRPTSRVRTRVRASGDSDPPQPGDDDPLRDGRPRPSADVAVPAAKAPTALQLVHQLALDGFTTAEEWSVCASIFDRRGEMLGMAERWSA